MSAAAVTQLDQLSDEDWDAALEASGQPYRFSHRAAAGRAFEAAYPGYRFEPWHVRYADGVELLAPLVVVERRVRDLAVRYGMPSGLQGSPVAVAGQPAAEHVESLFGALGGQGALVLHGGASGSPPGADTSSATHVLDLSPGFEALWTDAFSGKNRNSARKAERAGVEVGRDDDVDGYYDLYAAATVTWGYDEPPYPRELFSALLGAHDAELWTARLDDRMIAGAVVLAGSEDVLYWSGAMDAAHQPLAPSNAVIKAVVESACERGLAYMDFGASAGLPGVAKFKESFGAQPRPYASLTLSSRRYRMTAWLARHVHREGAAA